MQYVFDAHFSPTKNWDGKTRMPYHGSHSLEVFVAEKNDGRVISWLNSGPYDPTKEITRGIQDSCQNCLHKGRNVDVCNPDLKKKNEDGTEVQYHVNMFFHEEGPRGDAICPNHYSGPDDYDGKSHIAS